MNQKSEFAGTDQEFAVGSLKGIRSWGMDELGRLHGVTHKEVWTPGENVAKCQKPSDVACPRWEAYSFDVAMREQEGLRRKAFTVPPSKPKPCGSHCDGKIHHNVTHGFDPNCQCGFWAYDEDNFTSHGTVVGMIEGFGLTTIGTKGFRCQKARIIALVTDDLSRGRVRRLKQLYPDVEFYDTREAMLAVHEAVIADMTNPDDDEDFWTRPVKQREDVYTFGGITFGSYSQSLMRAFGQPQHYTYNSGGAA